ncbi:hypothetical protein AA0312_1682 [Acetobacter tropicalis NRIC 0312]|nr:conserved hypothetical protein [Acetobacter tropicalis]GBR70083.1 hypothetical protein AA0312_1682 [Acetobacter tropicalis NRIC 0312]
MLCFMMSVQTDYRTRKNAFMKSDAQHDTDDSLLSHYENQRSVNSQIFLFPTGRGNRGKSFFTRWAVEEARNAGREVIVADGDCTNQTLATYFPDAFSPPSADQVSITKWFESLVQKQIESRKSLIVDFGAGDRTLKHVAHELSLVSFLQNFGVQPVAIHFVGPDTDDLAYLQSFETDSLFAPDATIIVFNQFCVPPHIPQATAFSDSIAESEIIRQILDRGGDIVVMPTLGCAHEIERRRISFIGAVEGQTKGSLPPLGLIDRQRTRMWRDNMKKAFATVQHWLP